MGIIEGVGAGGKGDRNSLHCCNGKLTFLRLFFLSPNFCGFIINHRWIYRTDFELGTDPKVSELLSYCFFFCISCPLFLDKEESKTAAHSGSDKADSTGMSQ